MFGIVLICFINTLKPVKSSCRGIGGNEVCCNGYVWNDDWKICEKCPIGSFGVNCSKICVFPSYGENCQKECSCKEDFCDPSYGCHISSMVQETTQYFVAGTTVETKPQISTVTIEHKSTGEKLETQALNTVAPNTSPKDNTMFYGMFTLVGIFVLFFGIFVTVYLYKHCFLRTIEAKNINTAHMLPIDYKQLDLFTLKSKENASNEGNVVCNEDYLHPIFNRNSEYNEIETVSSNKSSFTPAENETVSLNDLQTQSLPEDIYLKPLSHQVYVEVIEEKITEL